jgi:hypothetical protein
VTGKELEELQSSVDNSDEESLDDIYNFSVVQVVECLSFLDSLFHPYWETTVHKLQRCFLVALVIHDRVVALVRDGDDMAAIKESYVVTKSKAMVATMCNQWKHAGQLKTAILSSPMLQEEVMKCLDISQDLESYDANLLQLSLRNLSV